MRVKTTIKCSNISESELAQGVSSRLILLAIAVENRLKLLCMKFTNLLRRLKKEQELIKKYFRDYKIIIIN